MNRTLPAALAALALGFAAQGVHAQAKAQKEFVPRVGQAGKDVIWVPTPDAVVKRMLELGKLGPRDFLVDLGSGDGRTVIAAAKNYGARALGVEFNPNMVELSRKSAAAAGVSKQAEFRRADIFATDFTKATVVTMYLLPELNLRLRPRMLDMRPGTRVVSHSFNMAEWEPDQADDVDGHGVYLWIVPAKIGGNWTLQQSNGTTEVTWTQNFQKIQGTGKLASGSFELRDAKLSGDQVSFAIVNPDGTRFQFSGRVTGDTMAGSVASKGRSDDRWTASRRKAE
jgi:hypothetical protein